MDMVALVDDIEAGIEALQLRMICCHRHPARRDAIDRQGLAIRSAPGVVAVRRAAYFAVVRRAAIG